MSRQIVAIDIRHHSITAVKLSTGLKSASVTDCYHVAIPGNEESNNPLGAALEQIAREVSDEAGDIVVSLPADRAIYRTLRVPFKEEKKVRQVLPFELEPHLPIDVDQLIIDYIHSNGPAENDLMTASVDRHHVEALMAQLEGVGLQPRLILPGDFPLAAVITAKDGASADQALLLSMGERKATVTLIDSGKIALVRSMAADASTEQGMETLTLKIRQTMIAHGETAPQGFTPQALYVSGPAFSDAGVLQRLKASLEMTPDIIDLHKPPFIDSEPSAGEWEPALFSGALALALVELEHLPCPSFYRTGSTLRNYWIAHRQHVRVPAVLLMVVLLLGFGGVILESHTLGNRLDDLDRQIEEVFKATFPQAKRVGDAGDQMKSELKKARTGNIDSGEAIPEARTIDILMQISTSIPKEIEVLITRLVLGNDVLTLSGETSAFNIVDDIKNRLEKTDLFQEVTIASANMEKSGQKVRFKLKLTL